MAESTVKKDLKLSALAFFVASRISYETPERHAKVKILYMPLYSTAAETISAT